MEEGRDDTGVPGLVESSPSRNDPRPRDSSQSVVGSPSLHPSPDPGWDRLGPDTENEEEIGGQEETDPGVEPSVVSEDV